MVNAAAANDYYGLVSGNDSKGINDLGLSWGNGWTLVAKSDDSGGLDPWQGVTFTVNSGTKSPSGTWSLTGSGSSLASGPLQVDMVAVVKSSTVYALYYFDDILFDGSGVGKWLSPSFNDKGVRQDLSHLSIYMRMGSPYTPSGGGTSSATGGTSSPTGGESSAGSGTSPSSGGTSPSGGGTSTVLDNDTSQPADTGQPGTGGTSNPSGTPSSGGTNPGSNTTPLPVPEPGSLALVALGLAGLGAVRRRSKAAGLQA